VWIGAAGFVESENGRNPLVEATREISIFGPVPSAEDEELDALRGEKVADRAEDDPRLSFTKADPERGVEAANPDGSFEALAAMFGETMAPPGGEP
jgi:hypothetical protein